MPSNSTKILLLITLVGGLLGVVPVPYSSKCSWSFHRFKGRLMFLIPVGLYCSGCLGVLLVSMSLSVLATFVNIVVFPEQFSSLHYHKRVKLK